MSGESMRCPHCSVETAVVFETLGAQCMREREDGGDAWYMADYGYCQSSRCGRLIVRLIVGNGEGTSKRLVEPQGRARAIFEGVPPEILSGYEQACAVLHLSPPASAALARRCLQQVIRGHYGIERSSLHDEIEGVKADMPGHLAGGLDRIREIGNLAAHPAQDRETGLIVDVAEDEAEWTLNILESLFRHCYVDPADHKRRTRRLEEKLAKTRGAGVRRDQAGQGGPSPQAADQGES